MPWVPMLSAGSHNGQKGRGVARGHFFVSNQTVKAMPTISSATSVLSTRQDFSATSSLTSGLRVLHVVNRLDVGGTEAGILKVMSGLDDSEFTHAICTARGHNSVYAEQEASEKTIFDASRAGHKFQFLVRSFARIMKTYRPHIVHSRNWGAIEAVFAARLAGVPVAIHSEHGYELDMLDGLPMRRRLLRRAAYGLTDAVFTVSSDLRDYHARQVWISPSRIRVLANGVDSERFAPSAERKASSRASLGLPASSIVIGSVGRLVPIKGHAGLLDAAEMLLSRGVDLFVVLVGDGSELGHLRAKAAALPYLSARVHFLGASKNVAEALNAMDVFVLPSTSEGMSNTLLEAMSAGLPVVATRVGGNPELIEDQVSGLLFSVGNIRELAGNLERLVASREYRESFGAAARARILTNYSLESMLSKYRDLYKELAARRGVSTLQAA